MYQGTSGAGPTACGWYQGTGREGLLQMGCTREQDLVEEELQQMNGTKELIIIIKVD